MTSLGITESEFNDLLDKVVTYLAKLSENAHIIQDAVTSAFDWLPMALQGINDLLARMWKLLQEIFDLLGRYLTEPGSPWALFWTGQAWTNQVGDPTSSLAGESSLNYVHIDDHWQGPAATAYKNTLPAQGTALAAIKAMCDTLNDALREIAIIIAVFWVACAYALYTAVIEFTGWGTAAGTVVGAPPAAAGATMSAAKVLGLIGGAATASYVALRCVLGPRDAMNQQYHNWTAFPQSSSGSPGNWPKAATADTSDANFVGGHDSKWRFLS